MTHWNKASKSSLHTKIWQLYHCTTWLLANIQCPVYPLKFYRLVSEGVNNNPPTPQIKYMYHMLLQLTVRFLISYTTYILLSLKIYTEKSICFWRHVLSVNAWTLPFFFSKISHRTDTQAGRHCVLSTLLDMFSRKHTRLPNPSAARHTRSVVSLSRVDVTQLRQNMSSYKTMAKHVMSYVLLPMHFTLIAYIYTYM